MDGTNRDGACAKFHVITYSRNSTIFATITDGYSMTQSAIAAYDDVRMDKYITKMINPQSWAYLSTQRKTDSS